MSQYLATGILGFKGEDGNINTYISPLLNNRLDKTNNADLTDMDLTHKIIKNIKYLAETLGMSSSRLCGVCEFDNKPSDNIECMFLKEAELFDYYYPYNMVNMDNRNTYKFDCLKLYYKMFKNILYLKDTFPKIINIKRSSGIIQKGLINKENSFSLYKTSRDNHKNYHIGLKVHFNNNQDDITNETEHTALNYSKVIFLQDVLEHNPDIKNIEFQFKLLDSNKYLEIETIEDKNIVKDVITYFNNIYLEWTKKIITEHLEKHSNITLNQIV